MRKEVIPLNLGFLTSNRHFKISLRAIGLLWN